jgi:hypothetical protein
MLPYAMVLVRDDIALVRVMAIRAVTALLSMVQKVPASDSSIIAVYVLPGLAHIAGDGGDPEVCHFLV